MGSNRILLISTPPFKILYQKIRKIAIRYVEILRKIVVLCGAWDEERGIRSAHSRRIVPSGERDSILNFSKHSIVFYVMFCKILRSPFKNSTLCCFFTAFESLLYSRTTKKAPLLRCFSVVAEREGFEPSERYQRSHDFQSCALDQLSHLSR